MSDGWMLGDLRALPGVRHTAIVTTDGLIKEASPGLARDSADRLAAACSGMHALGVGMATEHGMGGRRVEQCVVQFDGGFLFVRAAGEGTLLAVVAEAKVDASQVAYQMVSDAARMREGMQTAPRADQGAPAT
ncbi:roadblock/LC7 domain-containing protein [Actinocorallia aurea]